MRGNELFNGSCKFKIQQQEQWIEAGRGAPARDRQEWAAFWSREETWEFQEEGHSLPASEPTTSQDQQTVTAPPGA